MRILQLIDTLHPGGAERMAINYANALQEAGHSSFLVSTREEGAFMELLNSDIGYLFLNKRSTIDVRALKKLSNYIQEKHIDLVQAHGTSWFLGVLSKMLNKRIKLVWHDHYGESEYLENRQLKPLQYFSRNFDGIISVNEKLKQWAIVKLKCEKVIFLNNFIEFPRKKLKESEANKPYQLVCLANFREQKDHFTLLKACDKVREKYEIKLNLIGKGFEDTYSKQLESEINARNYIEYHGELSDPSKILANMHVGILSSKSEGLPLAILEYGANELAVICTEVGENKEVVRNHGVLIPSSKFEVLAEAILGYITHPAKRKKDGNDLKERIKKRYSKESVINKYSQFIENL
ncbi:glycosyltransferase family 4 protein [Christiangramia echinicola]|uniref:glycosyltransferase family 4 protein n=1 Tax=Christiangramia echinicola TaxID=279359 RepID=UPI00040C484B|nr:glycosyltransferase family 4 protein [Christiangramia echinicola]